MNKTSSAFFSAIDRRMWEPLLGLSEISNGRAKSLEERVARIEADREIRDLHLAYTFAYDGGDLAGAIRCFHKDCVLLNPRGTYIGIKAIEENYRYLISRRRFSFHNTTNVAVRISDDGNEAGMAAFLDGMVVHNTGTVVGLNGTYVDRLVRTDEGWRIIERRITTNVRYHVALAPQTGAAVPPPPEAVGPGSSKDFGEDAII